MPGRYQLKDKVRSCKRCWEQCDLQKAQKPWGREDVARVLEGAGSSLWVSGAWLLPVALTSSHGTAWVAAADSAPASDLLKAHPCWQV